MVDERSRVDVLSSMCTNVDTFPGGADTGIGASPALAAVAHLSRNGTIRTLVLTT